MQAIIRLEILIDGLATTQVLSTLESFNDITYSLHRSTALQSAEYALSSDDLSDSLSYNLLLIYIPKERYVQLEKTLFPKLKTYNAQVFISSCQQAILSESFKLEDA